MRLHVDFAAERNYAGIFGRLRSERLAAGLSQSTVASWFSIRARAVSEWETGAVQPTLDHLILLSGELGWRLVIVDRRGVSRGPQQRPGESWVVFERRRLATPLKSRRLAWGLTQGELGQRVGVSRETIQRWEVARTSPRPMGLIVWAQKTNYCLGLRPMGAAERRVVPVRLSGSLRVPKT
ncbi:transcriptional regulator [Catenulispora sp. NL8]|uniref:Transcriptional regulator n=1 Tax=Catenulispora pinistramenti TaxID=2705254 RepID=A0ABS5L8B3_9ACTN|nr:helix-turn-helix transcriptional regulator [Catenulispora pinistramenti]MBS2554578.1 transcriptional regulator [Catenulispora pinistramenti]